MSHRVAHYVERPLRRECEVSLLSHCSILSPALLHELLRRGIIVAGGAALHALTEGAVPSNDTDLWVLRGDRKLFIEAARLIDDHLQSQGVPYIVTQKNQHSAIFTFYRAHEHKLQLILHAAPTAHSLLCTFDFDYVQCAIVNKSFTTRIPPRTATDAPNEYHSDALITDIRGMFDSFTDLFSLESTWFMWSAAARKSRFITTYYPHDVRLAQHRIGKLTDKGYVFARPDGSTTHSVSFKTLPGLSFVSYRGDPVDVAIFSAPVDYGKVLHQHFRPAGAAHLTDCIASCPDWHKRFTEALANPDALLPFHRGNYDDDAETGHTALYPRFPAEGEFVPFSPYTRFLGGKIYYLKCEVRIA